MFPLLESENAGCRYVPNVCKDYGARWNNLVKIHVLLHYSMWKACTRASIDPVSRTYKGLVIPKGAAGFILFVHKINACIRSIMYEKYRGVT